MTVDKLTSIYSERAAIAVALARMALSSGFAAGTGIDNNEGNDPAWRVVLYIDLPTGQVSWHIAPNDQHLLVDLPKYPKQWDGTFEGRGTDFCKWEAHVVDAVPYGHSVINQTGMFDHQMRVTQDVQIEETGFIYQRMIHVDEASTVAYAEMFTD